MKTIWKIVILCLVVFALAFPLTSCGNSDESVAKYKTEMYMQLNHLQLDFQQLSNSSNGLASTNDIATYGPQIIAVCEDIISIDNSKSDIVAPSAYKDVDKYYKQALSHYSKGAKLYIQGINNLDVVAVQNGSVEIEAGVIDINMAATLLDQINSGVSQ